MTHKKKDLDYKILKELEGSFLYWWTTEAIARQLGEEEDKVFERLEWCLHEKLVDVKELGENWFQISDYGRKRIRAFERAIGRG